MLHVLRSSLIRDLSIERLDEICPFESDVYLCASIPNQSTFGLESHPRLIWDIGLSLSLCLMLWNSNRYCINNIDRLKASYMLRASFLYFILRLYTQPAVFSSLYDQAMSTR